MHAQRIQQLQLAIQRSPGDPALRYELGNLYLHSQPQQALECFKTALKLAPGHPQVLLQLGNAYAALGQHADAAAHFTASLQSDPQQSAAHYNLGNALRELGQPQQAAMSYQAALRLDPNDADSHNNLGNVLREMGKLDEAIACYRTALRLNPRLHHARLHLMHQRQHMCDWEDWDSEIAELRRLVREEFRAQISPFAFLSLPGTTGEEQRLCSEHWAQNRYGSLAPDASHLAQLKRRSLNPILRIGYLSADFRQHPLTSLALELIELHDRAKFETYGYSYGPDDRSVDRRRWENAFDHFREIRPLSLHQAAKKIEEDRIDILVDLTGYTQSSRTGILALRPAPLQVNWLGFPGTMGAPFVDYLITDRFITPPAVSDDYSEQLIFLPESYQPNNRERPDAPVPDREACGLPETGMVFCCFNQTFKITPQVFDSWMKILKNTAGSVLWLLECNAWAKAHLRQEAEARGVNPNRLIFAPRAAQGEHLARHRCADLFLDTWPYNAHTSTSDALWSGLPVLTLAGTTFASRVAGSLLHAAELPGLITHTTEEYENQAITLGTDLPRLALLRTQLETTRTTSPLFDPQRFARHLEQAYLTMWSRHVQELPPQGFNVDRI